MGKSNNREWTVWSEGRGTIEHALITDLDQGHGYGPVGYLAGPLRDKMGAFSVSDLMRVGSVVMRGYRVMTTNYWKQNEAWLRREFEKQNTPEARARSLYFGEIFGADSDADDRSWRACLGLPETGRLTEEKIDRAFRETVKRVHPDAGGDSEAFVRANEARDGLLKSVID